MTKASRNKLIAAASLIVIAVAMFLLSKNKNISEWLTTHVYFAWAEVFGPVFDRIPFDFFEVFMFLMELAAIIMVSFSIYYFVHKNSEKGIAIISTLLVIVTSIITIYSSTASIMYNRKPLDVPQVTDVLSKDQVIEIADKYFADLNSTASQLSLNEDGSTICPYNDQELEKKIRDEFSKLTSSYYAKHTGTPKQVASSYIMSAFSIAGISFIPTVEPGYNYLMPAHAKSVTIAHEISHTKGIMREDDANELAYYILLNSDDAYLKYVGYLYTYSYISSALKLVNNTKVYTIPKCVVVDKEISREFWDDWGIFSKLGDAINSLYLKSNSQDGTDSYISYDEHKESTIIDDEGQEITIYEVERFSNIQNMLFALYI